MTSPLLTSAVWLTRMWTRAYTWGMHPLDRDSRRAEIESDLWESQHDEAESDTHIARHVLTRLVGGLADDVRWRVEHPSRGSVRALAAIGTTGLIAAALWVLFLTRRGAMPSVPPPPPAPPLVERFSVPPPPPPPPPPPCVRCPAPSVTVEEELRPTRAAK